MKISFVETEAGERDFFADALPKHDLEFVATTDEVSPEAEIVSIFIQSKIDATFLDARSGVKLISTRSTGFDHVDLDACGARNVAVCIVPSYGDNTVAEHTFALMLSLSRRLNEAASAKSKNRFSYADLRGFELKEKTLGVIGAGRIGLTVIKIAHAFGMRTIAHDANPHKSLQEIVGFKYVPLDELLERSHVISLHLPLNADTFHLLNRERLAKCRPGAILINTARGALIDTLALIEALDSGAIGGAGLDVLEEESVMQQEMPALITDQILRRLQATFPLGEMRMRDERRLKELEALHQNASLLSRANVVFTPHIAFNSVEAVERINRTTVENIHAFAGGHPQNVISISA